MTGDEIMEAAQLLEALDRLPQVAAAVKDGGVNLEMVAYDGDDDGGSHRSPGVYIPVPLSLEVIEAATSVIRSRLAALHVAEFSRHKADQGSVE